MSIKKLLILSAASVVAVASAAAFAGGPDAMSGPMPAAPAPMMSDWTGWFAGGNLGGAIGNAGTSNVGSNVSKDGGYTTHSAGIDGAFNAANSMPMNVSSGVIGGQLGYNYEYADFVFGLESNFDYMPQTASATQSAYNKANSISFLGTSSVNTNWYDTVRGRLGYSFDDDTVLVYTTGGLALADLTYANSSNTDSFYHYPQDGVNNNSLGQTMIGWTAGGGLEWRFVANWSVDGEYLYNHFGTATQTEVLNGGTSDKNVTFTQNARLTDNIVTAGINYHF